MPYDVIYNVIHTSLCNIFYTNSFKADNAFPVSHTTLPLAYTHTPTHTDTHTRLPIRL